MNKVSVIVLAAGEGKRFGVAKQFVLVKGKTILDWSLEKFQEHESIDSIILVLGRDQSGDDYLSKYSKITTIARGGEKRQDSVYSGLNCVETQETEIVPGYLPRQPDCQTGAGKRVPQDLAFRQAEVPSHLPYLVLEKESEGFDQLEIQLLRQAADIVVRFYGDGWSNRRLAFNNVRIECSLRKKLEGTELATLFFEDIDKTFTDRLPLLFDIRHSL